jgi:hypothetical protein
VGQGKAAWRRPAAWRQRLDLSLIFLVQSAPMLMYVGASNVPINRRAPALAGSSSPPIAKRGHSTAWYFSRTAWLPAEALLKRFCADLGSRQSPPARRLGPPLTLPQLDCQPLSVLISCAANFAAQSITESAASHACSQQEF